jgi:hypothetical protein
MRLPKYKPTRYTLFVLVVLVSVFVLDFIRAIMKGGFVSVFGIAALLLSAPAMFLLAHFLGNHDLEPAVRQRNRERFIQK